MLCVALKSWVGLGPGRSVYTMFPLMSRVCDLIPSVVKFISLLVAVWDQIRQTFFLLAAFIVQLSVGYTHMDMWHIHVGHPPTCMQSRLNFPVYGTCVLYVHICPYRSRLDIINLLLVHIMLGVKGTTRTLSLLLPLTSCAYICTSMYIEFVPLTITSLA